MSKLISATLCLWALNQSTPLQASPLRIDEFTQVQRVTDRGHAKPNEVNVPGATSGVQTLTLGTDLTHVSRTFTALATEGLYSNKEDISSNAGKLTISNSDGSSGTASVLWNFDPTNFTLYGSAIMLDVTRIDLDVNIEMIVNGNSNNAARSINTSDSFSFDFKDFSTPDAFKNVTSLQLNFSGPRAWDGQFRLLTAGQPASPPSFIASVPVPPAFVMMGTALLGLLGVTRTRQSSI